MYRLVYYCDNQQITKIAYCTIVEINVICLKLSIFPEKPYSFLKAKSFAIIK